MADETGLSDDTLGVMTAVFNNELYAKRFKELLDVRTEAQALKEQAEAAEQKAAEHLAEAKKSLQEGLDAKNEAAAMMGQFNHDNEELGKAITNHNNTVNEFLGKRAEIEQGHRDTKAVLDAREQEQAKQSTKLQALAAHLEEWETSLKDKETELAEREARLAEIVTALSPKGKAA